MPKVNAKADSVFNLEMTRHETCISRETDYVLLT
jgi:hypothetical protein